MIDLPAVPCTRSVTILCWCCDAVEAAMVQGDKRKASEMLDPKKRKTVQKGYRRGGRTLPAHPPPSTGRCERDLTRGVVLRCVALV